MSRPKTAQDEPARATLARLLDLETLSDNHFRTPLIDLLGPKPLYGGQVATQGLRAASLTVPHGRIAHSLHGYYLQPGRPDTPIDLHVHRERDGRRYSVRRVTAVQGDAAIFVMSASFSIPKSGPEFQTVTMPTVPKPTELDEFDIDGGRTCDIRARVPHDPDQWHPWPSRVWVRINEPLEDDPNVQACGVVFLSDMFTGLSKAPRAEQVPRMPSLDHTVWMHNQTRVDAWHLIDLAPVATGRGRGVYTGSLFDESGRLIATLAQESTFDVEASDTNSNPSTEV